MRWIELTIGALAKLALLAVIALTLLWLAWRYTVAPLDGESDALLALELGGSTAIVRSALAKCCASVSIVDIQSALLRDSLVLLPVLAVILALLGWLGRFRIGRLAGSGRVVWLAGATAIGLDLVANVLAANVLTESDGQLTVRSDYLARWMLALGVTKWIALVGAVGYGLMAFWARVAPATGMGTKPTPTRLAYAEPSEHSICCSGGGIRSAAYTLGVLDVLEKREILQKARFLSGVSGGDYAATAWAVNRRVLPPGQVISETLRHLQAPAIQLLQERTARLRQVGVMADETRSVDLDPATCPPSPERTRTAKGRHRYLQNGPGGLPRAALWTILIMGFNIAVIAAFAVMVGWPIGLIATWWSELGGGVYPPELAEVEIGWRNTFPSLVWSILGAGFVGFSAWRPKLLPVALGCFGFAAFCAVALILVPVAIPLYTSLRDSPGPTIALITGSFGAGLALVGRTVQRPLLKAAPRLGGVLVAVAVIAFGTAVASDAALGDGDAPASAPDPGWFASPWVWLAVTLVLGLVYVFFDTQWISLRRVYATRLTRSFTTSEWRPSWAKLDGDRPELVTCCAVQQTGLTPNGLPAESFTISARTVTHGRGVVRTADYAAHLSGSIGQLQRVAAWMSVSGGAFSSAMGRKSLGTTNALLAATNLDLGVWVPAPERVIEGRRTFKGVRLGYLVKEILGIYDKHDEYVFVSDGGHWENLGLVELLRRRCRRIICIDASGDPPGEFTTLREAAYLATTALDDQVTIDLSALDRLAPPTARALPPASVVTLPFTIQLEGSGSTTGSIIYAKLMVSSDQPQHVRRFACSDPGFPDYSTGDQLLDDQQFAFLVEAGRAAGKVVAAGFEGESSPPTAPGCVAGWILRSARPRPVSG